MIANTKQPSGIYEKIYSAVRKIPKGRVATYGQIAGIVGIPKDARRAGYAATAPTGDVSEQLQRLEGMLQRGTLTQEEFDVQKARLLG